MRALVALVFLAIPWTGCIGGSGGMATYLMHVSEAPTGCDLVDYNGEEGRFLREQFNWTGNPGRVDNDIFQEDGIQPVDNLVGLMECDEGGIATVALRFATAEDAQAALADQDDDCDDIDDERWVENGPLVAFVDGDDDVPGMGESMEMWSLRVTRSTGAVDPCAPAGGNQTA